MKNALSLHRLSLERQTAHVIVRLPRPTAGADERPEALKFPRPELFALCAAKPASITRPV